MQPRESQQPVYHTISLSARPTRLAVVVPDLAEAWKTHALVVLEALSRCWGGAGDVLFFFATGPTVPQFVWRTLEKFDPDVFGTYLETFAAWRRREPVAFEQWLNATAARFVAEGSTNTVQQWRAELLRDSTLSQPVRRWDPDEALGRRVLETMAPLHGGKHVFADNIPMDWVPRYKFVDVATLEPVASAPLVVLETGEYGDDIQLLLAGRTGLLGGEHEKALQERNVQLVRRSIAEAELPSFLEYAWTGSGPASKAGEMRSSEGIDPTPFGHTLAGCAWFGREPWPPTPFVFVVGDTPDDFAAGLALDRITRSGGWVPYGVFGGPHERPLLRAMNSTIANITRYRSEERKVFVCSLSLTADKLNEVRSAIAKAGFSPDADEWVSVCSPEEVPFNSVWRIWDRSVNQRSSTEAFVDGVEAGPVPTPVASISSIERGTSVSWMVDAAITGHRAPARSCLQDLVAISQPLGPMVRPARDGISYFSFGGLIEAGLPIELNLSRPRLRRPTADEVFPRLLEAGGLRTEYSAAGLFARQTLELWGSLDAVADTLASASKSGMLRAFASTAPSGQAPGVFLDAIRRRFLTFRNFGEVTGMETKELRALVDDWLIRGILRRGLVLGCPACRFSGWYAIDDIGQTFRCIRCRRENVLLARAWKDPVEEPDWYYDLAETAYQAMAGNVEGPIRALTALKKDAMSFDFSHELEVFDATSSSHLGELDIWVIRDGRILVGEVSTTEDLSGKKTKKLKLLSRVADAVTADEVVLATTAPSWHNSVAVAAKAAFQTKRPQLRLLVGV
jgi:hypothetical protein